LVKTEGKTLLTSEEYNIVKNKGEQVRNCTHTREYFNSEYQNSEEKEYHYQFPIVFRCGKRECKGLLDLLVIDHKNKTIQIVDLKTTGKSNLSFPKSFI